MHKDNLDRYKIKSFTRLVKGNLDQGAQQA